MFASSMTKLLDDTFLYKNKVEVLRNSSSMDTQKWLLMYNLSQNARKYFSHVPVHTGPKKMDYLPLALIVSSDLNLRSNASSTDMISGGIWKKK